MLEARSLVASAVTWREVLTCVVSVLHYGHKLDAIVSEILYPGKDVGCELLVCRNLGLRRRDAHVRLVYTQATGLGRCFVLECISRLGWGVPEPGIIEGRDREVLSDPFDPSRKAFYPLASR